METALLDQGEDRLATGVDEAGSLVSRLRRQLQLRQRQDEMARQRETLQARSRRVARRPGVVPEHPGLAGHPLCGRGHAGAGRIGLVERRLLGWPVAILGLAGWLVAVVAKVSHGAFGARANSISVESQLELLGTQIKQAQQERDSLDAQLPHGSGSLEARSGRRRRKNLPALEELLPLEANLQTARQRAQTARRRLEQLTATLKEARFPLASARLRRANLPETLVPPGRPPLGRRGTRRRYRHVVNCASRREELAAREKELAALASRIEEIAQQVELNYTVSRPPSAAQAAFGGRRRTTYAARAAAAPAARRPTK